MSSRVSSASPESSRSSTPSSANARRVASMLCWMNGVSRACSFGRDDEPLQQRAVDLAADRHDAGRAPTAAGIGQLPRRERLQHGERRRRRPPRRPAAAPPACGRGRRRSWRRGSGPTAATRCSARLQPRAERQQQQERGGEQRQVTPRRRRHRQRRGKPERQAAGQQVQRAATPSAASTTSACPRPRTNCRKGSEKT